jgi:Flp pilus assembly secretin CpaC
MGAKYKGRYFIMIFYTIARSMITGLALLMIFIELADVPAVFATEKNICRATHYAGTFRLEPGKAVELATRHNISYVAVGQEKIADVVPVAPKQIRIVGIKHGSTNLIITYDNDYAEEYEICVTQGYTVEVLDGIITNPNTSLIGW